MELLLNAKLIFDKQKNDIVTFTVSNDVKLVTNFNDKLF